TFLKATLATTAVGLVAAAGLLKPTRVLAADWPSAAFESKNLDEAIKGLYRVSERSASGSIAINAQPLAEIGNNVPFTVSTSLPNVDSLAVFVEKNDRPLVASLNLKGAAGHFSLRMKMARTSDVHVVCRAGGKLYTAKQNIKVTVGGCGG
ncbi:MAG: thiosulfate oxidation carrier protein SoxY, partial [Pseudomonadota bacterium]